MKKVRGITNNRYRNDVRFFGSSGLHGRTENEGRLPGTVGNKLMYVTKTAPPIHRTGVLLRFNEQNQHTERGKQDLLLLTGAEDHFIPLGLYDRQVNALKNTRS
jgi:hypothetical protein